MLDEQIKKIRQITSFIPETAIVLGSGLGDIAQAIKIEETIDYSDIPDMPISTSPTHKGRFVFGKLGEKNIIAMQGRLHLYEGYTSKEVVMPIRIMRLLGAKNLILTNASGGISRDLNVGDVMMITDHISCFVESALIGKNDEALGERFPDMSNIYDKGLQKAIIKAAENSDIKLKRGIYAQLTGPQFETPAEIKMLSLLGADAVGMSTAIEATAAKHCGFKICAISLITNLACGILDKPLSGDEVTQTAEKVKDDFQRLIIETVKLI